MTAYKHLPTKTQLDNGFGTILASTGIPLAIELVKGALRLGRSPLQIKPDGHGAPRIGMYEPPPPFIGTREQMRGSGTKKKLSHQKRGKDCYSVKSHTVKPQLHKISQ